MNNNIVRYVPYDKKDKSVLLTHTGSTDGVMDRIPIDRVTLRTIGSSKLFSRKEIKRELSMLSKTIPNLKAAKVRVVIEETNLIG